MLRDHVIPKPPSVGAYASHQMLAGLTDGGSPLFCDMGDHLLVRSVADLTDSGKPIPEFKVGEVRAFELRASCGKKTKGRHSYFPLTDWRKRHEWLRQRSIVLGFDVVTVNCTARRLKIEKTGRSFHIDQTDFTGILRVTDVDAFNRAIADGVGSAGKTFGHSMLII